jgi:hypothetical protein
MSLFSEIRDGEAYKKDRAEIIRKRIMTFPKKKSNVVPIKKVSNG